MSSSNKVRLKDVSEYSKEKIDIREISISNYVSTENLIPDMGGKLLSSGLPSKGKATKYYKGDILISNIRPYFKKIWQAGNEGGSSNDILVLKAKRNIEAKFLYYNLAHSEFFDYVMSGVKGTKMPRGDKNHILEYNLNFPPIQEQKAIAHILSTLDEKIEVNNQINKILENMAQAIFDDMFPNVAVGDSTIGEYMTPKRGKNLLSKNAIYGDVPVVAGGLLPSTYHNVSNTQSPVITISASGANAGFINLWTVPVWSSDSSFIDYGVTEDVYFWYVMLKKRQKEIYDSQTGSAQPHIYPKHITIMPTMKLNNKEIKFYDKQVTPIFNKIANNLCQISKLKLIRDILLPKLMSGEIRVPLDKEDTEK